MLDRGRQSEGTGSSSAPPDESTRLMQLVAFRVVGEAHVSQLLHEWRTAHLLSFAVVIALVVGLGDDDGAWLTRHSDAGHR